MTSSINNEDGGFRLSRAGQKILDSIIDTAALHLYDLPAKRFVTVGSAVYDCTQVSVSLFRIQSGIGIPGTELVQAGPGCDMGWSVVFEAAIVRDGPKISQRGTVSAAVLNANTEKVSQDMFILMEAMEALAQDAFGGMQIGLTPNPPEGAMQSSSVQVTMALP